MGPLRFGRLRAASLVATGLVLIAWAGTAQASMNARGAGPGAATVAQASPTATATPQASPTATPTPQAPVVTRLRATLNVPVTTYAVTATDPGGGPLTYEWIMAGEACGTPRVPWTQRGTSVRWSHGDVAPDNCTHLGVDHDVVASVTVTTSRGVSVQCVITGSAPVDIPNPECRRGTFTGGERQTATPTPSPTRAPATAAVTRTSVPGTFDRGIPDLGVNTAVWNGGTIMELSRAVSDAGGISVTVFLNGQATVLIPGAPAFVNAAFNAAFPDGTVPADTIVLVVK